MKLDTNMLLLLGGGAVAIYFLTQRRSGSGGMTAEQEAAFRMQAQALNASQAQQAQMMEMYKQALGRSGGQVSKALQDQQLIGGYAQMGLAAAQTIASIVSTLA